MSAPETKAESCFIDTNIWLYAFTVGNDPKKTARAKALIEAQSAVFVSTQVINEACVNLIKKAHFSEQQVQQLIESFYAKYVVVELSKPLLLKASVLREQHALSFWDSIIVASALFTNVTVLYSEDMQDGLVVESRLRVVNPFKESRQTAAPPK
ncbi:MAG: PIN domain-containing protein [Deltaproteobacteria bacterium]|nr:PIN domain-containing protein [Deltaproteobacteria bacterium]